MHSHCIEPEMVNTEATQSFTKDLVRVLLPQNLLYHASPFHLMTYL